MNTRRALCHSSGASTGRVAAALGLGLSLWLTLAAPAARGGDGPGASNPAPRALRDPAVARTDIRANRPLSLEPDRPSTTTGHLAAPRTPTPRPSPATRLPAPPPAPIPTPTQAQTPTQAPAATPPMPTPGGEAPMLPGLDGGQVVRSLQTVGLFAAVSLAPAAVLMVTAFVRINIVLVLLRQALGSPQVPGNQVLTALALMLTALVMRPAGEAVYTRAIEPYAAGRLGWAEAYRAGSLPLKTFMTRQIEATRHGHYLWSLYDLAVPETPDRIEPVYGEDFPMRVVAPAFLLSELTTALVIGFYLYLPFLVVDLVVSAVLSAMGLFMMPPALVALPLKLILFVLADGWLHVATMLLQSFTAAGAGGGP